MMRIKEAIQRRKLIQQLNDDWHNTQIDADQQQQQQQKTDQYGKLFGSTCPLPLLGVDTTDEAGVRKITSDSRIIDDNQQAYLNLVQFVGQVNARLTDGQRRALRVTWNRLSYPPKTSGRGILKIMERVFEVLVEKNPEVMPVFYRRAFMSCLKSSSNKNVKGGENETIVTLRDHGIYQQFLLVGNQNKPPNIAHLLIELIDGIMCIMFDIPLNRPLWDPVALGIAHGRLIDYGFEKKIWNALGEVFAEVMFSQDCVRAYPQASSAWSMLIVAITDKMFRSTKILRESSKYLTHQISLQISPTEADALSLQFDQKVNIGRGDFRHYGFFPATESNLRSSALEKRKLERRRRSSQRMKARNAKLWSWSSSILSRASSKASRSSRSSRRKRTFKRTPTQLRRESIILKKIENHGIYGGLKEFAGREELFMLEDRKNSEEGYATLARNKMSQQNNNGESVSEHLLQKRPIPPIIIPERKAYHLSKPTSSKSSTAEAMAIVPVPSSRSSVRKQKPKIQKQPNIRDSFSQ